VAVFNALDALRPNTYTLLLTGASDAVLDVVETLPSLKVKDDDEFRVIPENPVTDCPPDLLILVVPNLER